MSEWTVTINRTFEVYRREFGLGVLSGYRTVAVAVTLSFVPCRLSTRTLVLHASEDVVHLTPYGVQARAAEIEVQAHDPYSPVDM